MTKLILCAVTSLVAVIPAQAEVYRWIDEQGRVHYSNAAPPDTQYAARGLDFRKYVSLQRGMTEGELLGIAGEPDLQARERSFSTYTYMPTSADPFTTTITLVRGRVSEIERTRKF